jgi:hypothetical protein
VLRKTSTPVAAQGPGLAVVLRSSDEIVPSWGGEILLRLDAIAPEAAFPHAAGSARPPEMVVVIVDGAGSDTLELLDDALENLGGADRIGIVDATSARRVLPLLPGSHRSLLRAAVERLLAQHDHARSHDLYARDVAGALATARGWLSLHAPNEPAGTTRHVLILTDGRGVSRGGAQLEAAARELAASGVVVTALGSQPLDPTMLGPLHGDPRAVGPIGERKDLLVQVLPPPGEIVLDDVSLSLSSVPAPARVIETSGGESALGLFADHLWLGQLYVGEARTEVVRLALPQWVPGEPLELTVTAKYRDVASGKPQTAEATIRCRYSANVEEIANTRHGDVIAYASALAMVRRLHRAFLGSEVDRLGGLHQIVDLQARSLGDLARRRSDPALAAQAEMLSTLLGVIED